MYSISVQIYIFWKSHPISSDFIGRFFFLKQIFSANFRILRGCGSMAWRRIGFKLAISLTLAQLILVGTNDIYIYDNVVFSSWPQQQKTSATVSREGRSTISGAWNHHFGMDFRSPTPWVFWDGPSKRLGQFREHLQENIRKRMSLSGCLLIYIYNYIFSYYHFRVRVTTKDGKIWQYHRKNDHGLS